MTLGTSHDTSEFACDSLFQWWVNEGIIHSLPAMESEREGW
ncbi:hypothetical protein [Bathymodiolus platifrons methanotrophic gill symbiont]